MVEIDPKRIYGRWLSGVALDVHTISSTHVGVDDAGRDLFENTRSKIGELLFRLKYRRDLSALQGIVDAAAGFLRRHKSKIDVIVPVPPSGKRAVQPVMLIARGVGEKLGVDVADCVRPTRRTTQLKGIVDRARRQELLEGLYEVDRNQIRGRKVLLLDDLFRSGATMNAITDLLLSSGKAECVRVLAVTRTRSNQ